ncbi:hypothetical protein ACHWQZ_G003669 [Mnemiopsis leidyi]
MFGLLLLSSILACADSRSGGGFYLLDQNKSYTNNGLLIADKIAGHKIGSVCDDNFDDNAAAVICSEMKFNSSLSYSSGVGTEYSSWDMKSEFEIVLDDVTCDYPDIPFSQCFIVTDHDCSKDTEQVFLECGCGQDSFLLSEGRGCALCPEGSVKLDNTTCLCRGGLGMIWQNEQCTECPANTYKDTPDNSPCQTCPEHSSSTPGSGSCSCQAGYFWNNGNCFMCQPGTVSVRGSESCVSCPSYTLPIHGNTACSCEAGLYWNSTHCTTCSANTYSTQNSVSCSPCPVNTVSGPGSAHCSPCPLGQYWQNYTCLSCLVSFHESCPRCPPGHTISPGNVCVPNQAPEPDAEGQTDGQTEGHTAAPKSWTATVLAICFAIMFAFVIVLAFMLYRSRRRRRPPKSAAPLLPYALVRESDTSQNFEEPQYETPFPTSSPPQQQTAVYDDLQDVVYVESEEPMYVQSDRGELTEYVQADSCGTTPGYSVFCGRERKESQGLTDNIYDNI